MDLFWPENSGLVKNSHQKLFSFLFIIISTQPVFVCILCFLKETSIIKNMNSFGTFPASKNIQMHSVQFFVSFAWKQYPRSDLKVFVLWYFHTFCFSAVWLEIRQSILYYAGSLVHLSQRTNHQASDVPSIIFFTIS